MSRMTIPTGLACLVVSTTILAQPQQVPPFEVVSVRLSEQSAPRNPFFQRVTDRRVDIVNISLGTVLRTAFRVKESQFTVPDWVFQERVHIHAILPEGATRNQVPEMLQRMLAERFGVIVRRETRTVEAYDLVVNK